MILDMMLLYKPGVMDLECLFSTAFLLIIYPYPIVTNF